MDKLFIVAGAAVDWDAENNEYILTVECVNISDADKTMGQESFEIEAKGKTIFEADRILDIKAGRELFWSHAKVLIVSQSIAKRGVAKVLDWFTRDAALRTDMWLMVSKEETAGEIFNGSDKIYNIVSYSINEMLINERLVSNSYPTHLWRFMFALSVDGLSPVASTVKIENNKGDKVIDVSGEAVFYGDRLKTFLDDKECMDLMLINGKLKGGIIEIDNAAGTNSNLSLEIFKSRTRRNMKLINGELTAIIKINLEVNIAEIVGSYDFTDKNGIEKLKKYTEEKIEKELTDFILKIQNEYETDIFEYGKLCTIHCPKERKKIGENWNQAFTKIKSIVKVDFKIIGSAKKTSPIEID